jgi:ParB family chromosome partitioning protein
LFCTESRSRLRRSFHRPGRDDGEAAKPGKGRQAETPAEADEEDISQALLQRLSVQFTKAAATALIQDEQLALSVLLAGVGCYSNCGVKVSVSGLGSRGDRGLLGADDMKRALPLATRLKPAERITLLAQLAANALDFQHSSQDHNDPSDGAAVIVNAIDAKAFNAAARGAFDAKDYFAGVSKMLNLKAIEEAWARTSPASRPRTASRRSSPSRSRTCRRPAGCRCSCAPRAMTGRR